MYQPEQGLKSAKAPFRAGRAAVDKPGEGGSRPRPSDSERWRSLDIRGRMARHADLTLQVMCHQISADYTVFFKRHVRPVVRRRLSDIAPRLNLREHSLMLALSQIPSGRSGVDLAFLIRTDPATVSRNVTRLCDKKIVEAKVNPDDSRAHLYTLTEAGFSLDRIYRREWRHAIARANQAVGTMTEMEFRDRLSAFYTIKDRAQAFAKWSPGARNTFRRGMGRPTPSVRPDIDAVRVDVDSFFRFFGQQISTDYLASIGEHLSEPLLRETETPEGPLTLTHLRTMLCLDFHDRAMSGAEIARAMRFDPATVARSTGVLELGGFISTHINHLDRRQTENVLTERGRTLAQTYRASSDVMQEQIEEDFGLTWNASARHKTVEHIFNARNRARKIAALRRLPELTA